MVKYKQFILLTLVGAPVIADLAGRTMRPPQTEVPTKISAPEPAPVPVISGGTVAALPPSGASFNAMQGQQSASIDGIDPTPAMDPTPALSPAEDAPPPPLPTAVSAPVVDQSGAATASAPTDP